MPQVRTGKPSTTDCNHAKLTFSPTAHAVDVGYRRPTFQQRTAATTVQGREPQIIDLDANDPTIFAAPLILPGDDLSLDPKYPPQSVRAWIREKERNKITPERRTIYVAAPPDVDPEVSFIRAWSQPNLKLVDSPTLITSPNVGGVIQYLSSFYYGLPVKLLPAYNLRFTQWEDPPTTSSSGAPKGRGRPKPKVTAGAGQKYVGLTTSSEVIRIRTRPSLSPAFQRQLNLDDLLDAAITVVPDDAYALLMLVEHDLFEDEDDEFTCGRAYGGSRVAVVSSARYHPGLDSSQGVDREHAWPASHCKKYLDLCSNTEEPKSIPIRTQKGQEKKETELDAIAEEEKISIDAVLSPLEAAVAANTTNLSSLSSSSEFEGLWLSRVCKTASHELGHCFGIDHCVYYACIMQGSASLTEDARQPPFLCPVDEAKVAYATGKSEGERRAKMIEFCNKIGNDKTHLFRALGAWLSKRTKG